MNLSLKFSRQLFKLSNREQIPKGQFRSQSTRKLLHVFLTEDVLRTSTKRNTQYICCPDTKYLENYLRETHGITNLEKYIALLENTQATKSEKAIHASDTKVKYKRVFDGFFVRTYHDFLGTLHGQPISLKPLHGSWLYIVDFQKFHINSHITIVGVENVETFRYIERYAHLFDSIKPLFLLRYNNNAYIEWLKQIKNPYLHFGDFDLSALAIYITEFRSKIDNSRCRFFIPDNIETLIKMSKNRNLYIKQLDDPKVKNINFNKYEEVAELAQLIMRYQKVLEQESLAIS